MNKIVLENDIIIKQTINKDITINYIDNKDTLDVANLIITMIKDTNLELYHQSLEDNKINITFNIKMGVKANLFIHNNGVRTKIKVNYNLEENSLLNVFRFNYCLGMRELDIVNFNGNGSKINYSLKTISKESEKYDLMFYHKGQAAEANINVGGVNVDKGNLIIDVTNVIYRGMVKCVVNQNSRIILFNDNKCQINPNLLVDEYDVSANHSAIIGKFSDEEMFYLNSRGINDKQATNLLVRGFLMENFNRDIFDEKVILKIIDEYWG